MKSSGLMRYGVPFLLAATVVLVIFIPSFVPSRWQHIVIVWFIWSIVGMGFLVLLRVGEFSLGQAVFLLIGGYTSAVLTVKAHLSFWIALVVGGVASAIIALIMGVIVLRLRGLYFAIITLAFAEVLRLTVSQIGFVGGHDGMWSMPRPMDLGPVSFISKEGWLYLSFFLLVVTGLTFWRLERSRLGRLCTCIAAAPELAQSLGVHLMKYKVQVYVVGGFFTGLAGATMGHYLRAVGPAGYSLWESLMAQVIPIIGGVPFMVAGPVAGAFVLTAADDYVGNVTALAAGGRPLIFGSLLLLVIFFLPDGLLSVTRRLRRGRR